jgi:hypothetical protein
LNYLVVLFEFSIKLILILDFCWFTVKFEFVLNFLLSQQDDKFSYLQRVATAEEIYDYVVKKIPQASKDENGTRKVLLRKSNIKLDF